MKKFLTTLFVLLAFAVTMFPITATYASTQTVECSWWGKMVNGEYDDDSDDDSYYEEEEEESAASSNEDED